MKQLKHGDVVYFLDRGAYNVNKREELVKKMDVVEKAASAFNRGGLYATCKDGYYTIEFEVSPEKIKDLTKPERPSLFETCEAGLVQYDKENNASVKALMDMSKEELVSQLFSTWDNAGTAIGDRKYHEAMKEKIKQELGVEVGR